MPAVIIRSSDVSTLKKLAETHPTSIIVHDETSLARRAEKHFALLFGSSDLPNEFKNEPSLEQANTLLCSLTPMMKRVLRDLHPAKRSLSLKGFDRELNTAAIEGVVNAFRDRAVKAGFTDQNNVPVEIISVSTSNTKSGEQTRYRLASTARRAIDLFNKPIFD